MVHKTKKITLLLGDIALFYACLLLTLWVRYLEGLDIQIIKNHIMPFTFLMSVWMVVFYISDLYDLGVSSSSSLFFKQITKSFIISTSLSIAFFYFSLNTQITPKTNLGFFIAIFFLLFLLWRNFFNWALRSYLPKNRIAFLGFNQKAGELIDEIRQRSHLGYDIDFIFSPGSEEQEVVGVPIFTSSKDLFELIKKRRINTIVITPEIYSSRYIRSILFSCLPLKINILGFAKFYELNTGKIPIENINQGWFLENLNESKKSWFDILKRIYDISFSLILSAFFIILLPFPAIIIKLESKGPIFFKQKRMGKDNKVFTIIKLRTMTEDGNDHSPTRDKDMRITKIGNILRKTRIDEIPQVINILKGDMSFIGPRPERPDLIAELERKVPFYKERMLVKPGITGWDQVSGEYHSPSVEDTLEKLQYDLFYIKNRSMYLDLSIMLKTVATVASRSGK